MVVFFRVSVYSRRKPARNKLIDCLFMKLLMNEDAEFLSMDNDFVDGLEFYRERELDL